jgi:UDP-galactopyranose mutase
MTLHQVFSVNNPRQAAEAMLADSEPCDEIVNMEQYCLHHIGRTLYDLFIKHYTTKQWGVPPTMLPASIIKRIPVRLTHDDAYFSDMWQGIPTEGYTKMVERMLDRIPVLLNVDFNDDQAQWLKDHDLVVYSGPIDGFFHHCNGELGYRSLTFRREIVEEADAQGCAVINHCDQFMPYTRVIEHKHFMPSHGGNRTLISFELPSSEGEPFYPINTGKNQQLLETYRKLGHEHFPNVVFGGRLGSYCYLDMHQVIASALAKSRELMGRL